MLVAASVVTTKHSRLRARWKLEGGTPPVPGQKTPVQAVLPRNGDLPLHWEKSDYRMLDDGELGPSFLAQPDFAGLMQVYDWETGGVIWRSDWNDTLVTPCGFCFADGVLYVADLESAHVFVIDVVEHPGKILRRISHPYLNDIHSLMRTSRGLLVTSSGVDAILELSLEGEVLWEWWAAEHGYSMTPSGRQRESGRNGEHRNQYYHTRYQSTHVNSASVGGDDDRFVFALLFHQGALIRIDRTLEATKQHGDIVMEGLMRPHALERTHNGWQFANSVGGGLVFLDDHLAVQDQIPYDAGWIQDCTRLQDGRVLLNDVDNHRIVEFSPGPPWVSGRVVKYDDEWRMCELVEVPSEYEAGFLQYSDALGKRRRLNFTAGVASA
jgi:hypothetical protein